MIFNSKDNYPNKIFCIGRNKTGTTSLQKFFENHGFVVGDQRKGELLYQAYKKREYNQIVEFCRSASVFQDFPFSYPETFYYLDKAFPSAKFILTVRDSPEQWYNSIYNYYSVLFSKGRRPSAKDFLNANYVEKGWMYEVFVKAFCLPEEDPMNKQILINHYNYHNNLVCDYFENRKNKFLKINLADKEDYFRLCKFLNISNEEGCFPWENRFQ